MDIVRFLNSPISIIDGVGPKRLEDLKKLGYSSIRDLLLNIPFKVIDRSYSPHLSLIKSGDVVTKKVKVLRYSHTGNTNYRRQKIHKIECIAYNDASEEGTISITYFNQHKKFIENIFPIHADLVISGKIDFYNKQLTMSHPDIVRDVIYYDKIKEIEPVYRSIATLNSKTIWDLIRKILTLLPTDVPEKIPQQILEKYDFVSWRDSINKIHMPESPDDISLYGRYVTRLAFEEMSEYQSKLSKARVRTRQVTKDSLSFTGELFKKLKALLPFQLTPDQLNVIDEITADQKSGQRMVRLIQGDVGSGKTLVAFAAMLHVKESGKQSALMAPTDILVKQHYNSLQKFSDDLSIKLAVLTGTMKKNEKVEVIQKIKDGEIDIIIGTHALFQSYVEFKDLGLIVVDEQHRFGVMQRYRMLQKNKTSDFLMMSATPIPRTLSMIAYGDMNISTIKNKPSNRIAIKTSILSLENIDKLIDALVKQDTKIYWLCPLINESEKISISNVMDRCKILEEKMPKQVAFIHGKMTAFEQNSVMSEFSKPKSSIKVLVATTVIEVGVDISDANIMVIENAERFGLAQIHQLRGRIGRGDKESNCILLYKPPLTMDSKKRLDIIRSSNDGFFIGEQDMLQRGGGEVLGTRQIGFAEFKVFNYSVHHNIMGDVLGIHK